MIPATCVPWPLSSYGVDNGHTDAGAGVPQPRLHGPRAHRDGRAVQASADRTIEVHAEDVAVLGQLAELRIRQLNRKRVDEPQLSHEPSAERRDMRRRIHARLDHQDYA
jgi:hypothetical protein